MPGVVVTDLEGKIIYLSKKYASILEVDSEEVVGKDVREIIPGTRMHIIAKTGQEEMGSIFELKNGETILVNRIVVRDNDKIIGAAAFSSLSRYDEITTVDNKQDKKPERGNKAI